MNGKVLLTIPMDENDVGAISIGDFLGELLLTLWNEKEGFSGKRPFGNSAWDYDVYAALIKHGAIPGTLDEDGYVEEIDDIDKADEMICGAIKSAFSMAR